MSSDTTGNLFPAIDLTPEQHRAYEEAAQRLLDSTVRHYQLFNNRDRREMSRKHWKPVKSRENLTVYKERIPQPAALCDVGDDWKDPLLLVTTGAIAGKLDDVMYGVATPDAAAMLLKASITKNRCVGGAVLNQIQGPTVDEPYRFLGIKWLVMSPPAAALNAVVRSRDLVFVEATGIQTLPDGERVGYQLMQSVDIPGYGSLEHHSLTRGRISFCSVFKQLANGTVDVYLRGYVEALGKVIDAVAHKMAASGFSSSWNTVGCARYKKLMWCVQHSHGRASVSMARHNYNSCADCNKRFGAFSSAGACILCRQRLCSRCRVVSKLRVVDAELCLEESEGIICNKCVAHVDNLSTVEIAIQEVLSGRFTSQQRRPIIRLWSFQRRSKSRRRRSMSLLPGQSVYENCASDFFPMRANSDCVMLFDPTQLFRGSSARSYSFDSETMSLDSVMTPMRAFDSFDESVVGDGDEFASCYPLAHEQVHGAEIDDEQQQQQELQVRPKRVSAKGSDPQEQLWQQMLDLQLAAEHAYQLTMKNSDEHLQRDVV
ncbi:hypothetical protein Gpo141_00010407 [Globisporangium polare]